MGEDRRLRLQTGDTVADLIYVRQVQLRAAANASFRPVVQYHVNNTSFQLKYDVEQAWYASFLCHRNKHTKLYSVISSATLGTLGKFLSQGTPIITAQAPPPSPSVTRLNHATKMYPHPDSHLALCRTLT